MDMIIAGAGKVGLTSARQLAADNHNITLLDMDRNVLDEATEQLDAIAVCGKCASREVLLQAGLENAELVIAATNADELNLL